MVVRRLSAIMLGIAKAVALQIAAAARRDFGVKSSFGNRETRGLGPPESERPFRDRVYRAVRGDQQDLCPFCERDIRSGEGILLR
jgi:hypothetical protein